MASERIATWHTPHRTWWDCDEECGYTHFDSDEKCNSCGAVRPDIRYARRRLLQFEQSWFENIGSGDDGGR